MAASEFWGQSPFATTVLASPTPTTTQFTVGDAIELVQGQWVLVEVDGEFERTKITVLSGNQLTVSPALSQAPDVPGELRSGRTLVRNTLLNQGAVFHADTPADLIALDTNVAKPGLKYAIPQEGYSIWRPTSASPADGYVVRDSDVLGQWERQSDMGDFAPAWLACDIAETLPAVLASLNFPSISSGSESTLTVTVRGARAGDFVIVQEPGGLDDGVIVRRKWVSAKNTVSIRLRNLTGGAIDPAEATWGVIVSTGKRLPPVMAPGIEIYEQLLGGYLDATALEALLSDGQNESHFRLLVASRQRMQALLDSTDARAAIEGSPIADSILEEFDGAGY